MKKIFLLFAAVCVLFACDPTHEKIGNGGHITMQELLAKTKVDVPLSDAGNPGNVIICETLAPVNAVWQIGDKSFVGTSAKRKMKPGEYAVKLTALCADGTVLENEWIGVLCVDITDPLQKIYIYGEKPEEQPPFSPGAWDASAMRFSDSEGQHFPFLSDEVYWGYKTLIIDVANASDDITVRIMSGWWDNFNEDGSETIVKWVNGLNEVQITEAIAKICAKGNGGKAHDLQFMLKSGSCTVNSVYYEE